MISTQNSLHVTCPAFGKDGQIPKKRFFIPACVLLAAAVGFVIYALGHPELSFP